MGGAPFEQLVQHNGGLPTAEEKRKQQDKMRNSRARRLLKVRIAWRRKNRTEHFCAKYPRPLIFAL
ncbi:MAG: hypothetical protein DMG57_20365 [Acidobacteria bacterium]|nr:MAG: hypothetical protein DMG57_20365 [Acidobacteriota bacterium]